MRTAPSTPTKYQMYKYSGQCLVYRGTPRVGINRLVPESASQKQKGAMILPWLSSQLMGDPCFPPEKPDYVAAVKRSGHTVCSILLRTPTMTKASRINTQGVENGEKPMMTLGPSRSRSRGLQNFTAITGTREFPHWVQHHVTLIVCQPIVAHQGQARTVFEW